MRKNLKLVAHSEMKTDAVRRARLRARRGCKYSRRRGQTLLLAVLLMVFAALLGATFITVVALNLSQTSRGTNRGEAQQAAFAGIRYANDRIVNSIQGERWVPDNEQTPPTAGAQFDAYYSPFEQAQGWAGIYAKYPDPRALNSTLRNSPTFLLRVRRVKLPNEPNPDPDSGEHGGQLQLDVIGRSAEDDAVFARRAAYKPTSENGGPGAFARYDSNYDFGSGRVVQTKTIGASTVDTDPNVLIVTLNDADGLNRGRTVLVETSTGTLAATVAGVNPSNNQARLRFANTGIVVNGNAVVRAASPLTGNIQNGNFNATGDATATASLPNSSQTTATPQDAGGGILINGGLALIDQIKLFINRDTANPQNNDNVRVAGLIARDNASTAPGITEVVNKSDANDKDTIPANGAAPAPNTIQTQVQDNSAAEAGDPTAAVVRPLTPGRIDGADSRYLKLTRDSGDDGAQYGYGRGVYIDNAGDVEKVGRLINGQPELRPLSIFEMQRLWQRKSFPKRDGEAGNVNNGGGPGDVNGAYTGDNVAPTNNTFHRLAWRDLTKTPVAGTPYNYPLQPAPAASPSPSVTPTQVPQSLEERGIRGWVSPWEYKPRGTLIELQGNNIIITRDDRSDAAYSNDANFAAPTPNKAWRDDNGALIGAAANGGKIYRMRLEVDPTADPPTVRRSFGAAGNESTPSAAEPFNGVIYAEGNLRVRGFLNTSMPDVTIASMNNIYVEGSIRRIAPTVGTDPDKGHIALLAKNNVVLNPTLFATPLEGSGDRDVASNTITASPAAVGDTTLTVSSIASLRIGDLIRVGKNLPLLSVTAIALGTAPGGTVTFSPALTTAVEANASVRVLADPQIETVLGYRPTNPLVPPYFNPVAPSYAYGVSDATSGSGPNSTLMRDLRLDDATVPTGATYGIAMRHIGRMASAFTLTASTSNPNPRVRIKFDTTSTDGTIQSGEKLMELFSASSATPSSTYDLLQPNGTATRGDDSLQTLTALGSRVLTDNPTAGPPPLPYWTATAPAGGTRARQLPLVDQVLAPGDAINAPLTVSTRLFWIPNVTTTGATTANLDLQAYGFGSSFGWNTAASAYPATDDWRTLEDASNAPGAAGALSWNFYQTALTTTPAVPQQAEMRWFSYSAAAPFSQSRNVFGILADNGAGLPSHEVGAFKMERTDNNGFFGAGTGFNAGMDVEVDAQIYAQNGSWFVIPMPTLEPAINVNSAAYLAMTPAEQETAKAASTRFRRLNYDIAVRGTISQNFAPPLTDYDTEVDPDGVATGPQQRWIDSLAFPTAIAGTTDKYGTQWTTIRYIGEKPPAGNTLKMPVSPDLLYVN